MARVVVIKNGFNAGEISPYALARTDLDQYKNACEQLQNFIPLVTGGITRRPGTRFVYAALGPSRLVTFEYSTEQTFALEFGDLQLRFFTIVAGVAGVVLSGGIPYVVTTPYNTASDDLWDLKFAQQGDVMYITHPNHPVMKLSRITDTNWRLTQPAFQTPPTHAFDQDVSGGTITLTPGAASGTGVTFTASAPVFINGDIGKFIFNSVDGGLAIITALGGSTSVDGTTGATLYPQATCDIADPLASTSAIAAGSWLLRGPPQAYAQFCSKHADGNVKLSRKLGEGAEQPVYAFANYQADGTVFPIGTGLVDAWREVDIGRYLICAGSVSLIVSLTTANEITIRLYSPIEDTTTTSSGEVCVAPQSGGAWDVEDPAFSSTNGYPNACTFFQDRLCLAGTAAQPLEVWGSRTGDYENFAKGPQDADALDFGINSAVQQPIRALAEFRGNLGCFTAREEYMVGGGIITLSSASPQSLTPSNATAVKQSQYGTSRIQPQTIQNMLIYLWRSKMAPAEMSYNIYQANFGSRRLNVLSELIATNPLKEMVWQQFPYYNLFFTSELAGIDGSTRADLIGLTYEVNEKVEGWWRFFTGQDLTTPDQIVSMCVTPDPATEENDNVWYCVARQVNGSTSYMIEIADSTLNTDSASQTTFGSPVTSVSGLTYLQGRTVQIKVDGMYLGTFVVPDSGTVSFEAVYPEGGLNVEVGLPYVSLALTVRPELGGNGQTVQGLKKTWNRVFARVYNTINLLFGAGPTAGGTNTNAPTAAPYRLLGRPSNLPLGTPTPAFTGDVPLEGALGADFDGRLLVEQDQPFPCTVLAPFGIFTVGEM